MLSGLFENLHSVRFLDINFKKACSMADRMAEADSMLRCGGGLMAAIPFETVRGDSVRGTMF